MQKCVCVCLCVAEFVTNQHLVGWPTNLPSLHKISGLIILRYAPKTLIVSTFLSHTFGFSDTSSVSNIHQYPTASSRTKYRGAPHYWWTFSTFKSPSDRWFSFKRSLNSSAWSPCFVTAERIFIKEQKARVKRLLFHSTQCLAWLCNPSRYYHKAEGDRLLRGWKVIVVLCRVATAQGQECFVPRCVRQVAWRR